MFSMAMWMLALVAPVQIVAGDLHGLNTLEHQPAKVMAMEGHYESHPQGAPLALFGIPDDEEERLKYALEIPKLSSLILKHDPNAPLAGLKTIPKDERPPAEIIFWSFRIMVGLGFLMLGLGLWSLFARWRKRLYEWKLLHRFALLMGPAGFVAVIAGWVTTEVGRQPYVIYNLMRTAEARAPIDAPAVATSLLIFVIVYFLVFGAGTIYILRLMKHAPHQGEAAPAHSPIRTAGITPSTSIRRRAGSDPRPDASEEAR
jgi:cytochrome d ubiquinol oxidase subunit I